MIARQSLAWLLVGLCVGQLVNFFLSSGPIAPTEAIVSQPIQGDAPQSAGGPKAATSLAAPAPQWKIQCESVAGSPSIPFSELVAAELDVDRFAVCFVPFRFLTTPLIYARSRLSFQRTTMSITVYLTSIAPCSSSTPRKSSSNF